MTETVNDIYQTPHNASPHLYPPGFSAWLKQTLAYRPERNCHAWRERFFVQDQQQLGAWHGAAVHGKKPAMRE